MTTSTTAKEVEELIIEAMKRRVKPYKILLVLYNVDCNNLHHLELARSLCEGRNIFIANQKRWIELTDLTVCIESSSTITEDTPDLLTALVSKSSVVCLEENFDELQVIFAELLKIFFEEDLGLTIANLARDVAKLIVSIYRDARKISSLFNRYTDQHLNHFLKYFTSQTQCHEVPERSHEGPPGQGQHQGSGPPVGSPGALL